MIKYCILLVVITIGYIGGAYAQRGFIVKDSSYSEGFLTDQGIFRNNRSIVYLQHPKNPSREFFPNELSEFGFTKGDRYVSREVPENNSVARYFLLYLVDHKDNKLYQLETVDGTRFFTEINGSFIELKRETFREQLRTLFTKADYSGQIASASYKASSLIRLFKLYNSNYEGLSPTFRFGASVGVINQKVNTSSMAGTVSLSSDPALSIGLVADFPFIAYSNWFINLNLLYHSNAFSKSETDASMTYDHLAKTSSLSLPAMLKYSSASKTLRYFIKAGPIVTYLVNKEYLVYRAEDNGNEVLITQHTLDSFGAFQLGGAAGAGLEYSLGRKFSIGIEARYSYEGAFFIDSQKHTTSNLALSTYLLFSK